MGKQRIWKLLCFGVMAVFGSGCDLVTKSWAEESLLEAPGNTLSVAEPWLDFTLAYNRGTAFSMVGDLGSMRWLFGLLALSLVAGMVFWTVRARSSRFEALALGTIAGGAIGNGYERLFNLLPDGSTGVVDFIRFNYPSGGHWPIFNIADVLVFVGAASLILAHIHSSRVNGSGDPPEANQLSEATG